VSLPLEATTSSAPEGPRLDDWFAGLGDEYAGRVPADSLRPRMVEGWRLRWRGRELEVQVDADFPFSAARIIFLASSGDLSSPKSFFRLSRLK
jgi:hypothetical protein